MTRDYATDLQRFIDYNRVLHVHEDLSRLRIFQLAARHRHSNLPQHWLDVNMTSDYGTYLAANILNEGRIVHHANPIVIVWCMLTYARLHIGF